MDLTCINMIKTGSPRNKETKILDRYGRQKGSNAP
jgi:hypothetical protein